MEVSSKVMGSFNLSIRSKTFDALFRPESYQPIFLKSPLNWPSVTWTDRDAIVHRYLHACMLLTFLEWPVRYWCPVICVKSSRPAVEGGWLLLSCRFYRHITADRLKIRPPCIFCVRNSFEDIPCPVEARVISTSLLEEPLELTLRDLKTCYSWPCTICM